MKKLTVLTLAVCVATASPLVAAVTTVDLIADGPEDHIIVGNVTVEDNGATMTVVFTITAPGWVMTETHLAVATTLAGIPQTGSGNPKVGKFTILGAPGGVDHDPPVTTYTYGPFAISPGTTYYIAAHAAVELAGDEIDAVATVGDGDDFAGFVSTAGFSTTDSTNNLGTDTLGLLGGFGELVGSPRNLSHRGTRGLGVQGGEEGDEVDGVEDITLTFDVGVWISALELRSLFSDGDDDLPEVAEVILSLNGSPVHTETLVGTQPLGSGNGVVSASYGTPIKADEVVVQIPTSNGSEGAFARLEFAREETAWGEGYGFAGSNWAMYFVHTTDTPI